MTQTQTSPLFPIGAGRTQFLYLLIRHNLPNTYRLLLENTLLSTSTTNISSGNNISSRIKSVFPRLGVLYRIPALSSLVIRIQGPFPLRLYKLFIFIYFLLKRVKSKDFRLNSLRLTDSLLYLKFSEILHLCSTDIFMLTAFWPR